MGKAEVSSSNLDGPIMDNEGTDLEKLKEEIDREDDIVKIEAHLRSVPPKNKEGRQRLANSIDLKALREKIDKSEDLLGIRFCLSALRTADKKIEEKLIEQIDIMLLEYKLERSQSLFVIGDFVGWMTEDNPKIGERLIDVLADKINSSHNIEGIEMSINDVIYADNEVGKKLIQSLNLGNLSININKSFDESGSLRNFHIGTACYIISEISIVDREIAKGLAQSLDLKKVIDRIDSEEAIKETSWWILYISKADIETGLKVLKSVKKSKEIKECMISTLIPEAENFKDKSFFRILQVLIQQ